MELRTLRFVGPLGRPGQLNRRQALRLALIAVPVGTSSGEQPQGIVISEEVRQLLRGVSDRLKEAGERFLAGKQINTYEEAAAIFKQALSVAHEDPAFSHLLSERVPKTVDLRKRRIVMNNSVWSCAPKLQATGERHVESYVSLNGVKGPDDWRARIPFVIEYQQDNAITTLYYKRRQRFPQARQFGTLWPSQLPSWAPTSEELGAKNIITEYFLDGQGLNWGHVWFKSAQSRDQLFGNLKDAA